jgi:uracil-DNA glycosylase
MGVGADVRLKREIEACTVCAPFLPHAPRPIIRMRSTASIVISGQAPSALVHRTGLSFNDPTGDRLRAWMGISKEDFYDESKVALIPMAFCFPGRIGDVDAPPRPECAPLWHERVFSLLPKDRLNIVAGTYSIQKYLPEMRRKPLADTVRQFRRFGPHVFPIPLPSWRVLGWLARNPWFEEEVLPELRKTVRKHLR